MILRRNALEFRYLPPISSVAVPSAGCSKSPIRGTLKERGHVGGSPSSSHIKSLRRSVTDERTPSPGAFCYPYLVACTRKQTEEGEGRRRRWSPEGKKRGWKRKREDGSKIGSHSLGPFPLYVREDSLLFLQGSTVDGKVYTTPARVQNHPALSLFTSIRSGCSIGSPNSGGELAEITVGGRVKRY